MQLKHKLTVVTSAALFSPLALAVSTSPASAAGLCDGYDKPTARTIQQGQTQIPWSYVPSPNPGTYSVCLDGPDGTDLDLVMKRWDDAAYQWATVATSTTPGPDEKLTYTETLGSTAYLIYVTAVRGSGDYTLAYNHTPAG